MAVVRGIPDPAGWRVCGVGLPDVLGLAGLEQIRSTLDTGGSQAQNEDMMRWLRNLLRMRASNLNPLPPPARGIGYGAGAPRPYRDIDDFMRPANPPDWE